MSDAEKIKLIQERGWYPWYSYEYWCHEQFASEGVDPTTRGMSVNEAYAFETDPESRRKTLEGMAFVHGALKALSNTELMREVFKKPTQPEGGERL